MSKDTLRVAAEDLAIDMTHVSLEKRIEIAEEVLRIHFLQERMDELRKVIALPGHWSARDYDLYCTNRYLKLKEELNKAK